MSPTVFFLLFLLVSVSGAAYDSPKPLVPVAVAPLSFAHSRGALAHAPSVKVSRTKDCPPGYSLVGKDCQSFQVVPAALVCPQGTTNTNGQCLTFAHASHVCPPGTQQIGSSCLSTQVAPASYNCHMGQLDHNSKMCEIITEVPPVCPPGYNPDASGECSRTSQPAVVCPPGHSLEGHDTCAQVITSPASPTCDADMSLNGVECTKMIPSPPYCPSGYTRSGNECVQALPMVTAPCPPGFQMSVKGCVRTLEFVVSQICPEGFSLAGDACVHQRIVPPTCPPNTIPSSGGACEKYIEPVPYCPEGLIAVNNHGATMCKQLVQSEPDLTCPSGFGLSHGKCKKVVVYPVAAKCAYGTLQGNVCVDQTESTPVYQCPPEYQLAKGPKCVREVAFDCSSTVTTQQCEFPAEVASLMRTKEHLPSKVVVIDGKHRQLKEAAVSHGKEPVCRDVSKVVPKMCSKTEMAPVSFVCHEGGQLTGDSCLTTTTLEAEIFCPRGLLDQSSGQCLEIKILPVNKVCPRDSHLEGKLCIRQLLHAASHMCPENSETNEKGRCFVRVQEIHHAPEIIKQSVQLSCERGQLVHDKCIDTEVVPKEFMCPQGTYDAGGKCITAAPMITPAPTIVNKPAFYVCPDGQPAVHQSCHSTASVPADRVCHDNGSLQGDRCVHYAQLLQSPPRVSHINSTPSCPNGYTLEGPNCVLKVQESASVVCPSGYELQDGKSMKCAASHAMTEVCPPGTQRGNEGCVSRSVVAPQVTIVKQCTKGSC